MVVETGTVTQNEDFRSPGGWKGYSLTPKTDIWSLRVVLAHLLAGKDIFGDNAIIKGCSQGEYCIAKIVLLRGGIGGLPDS
ncbi:hypothetical protein IFR05_016751 [Cadophora sp. M221]|nr:hypothetical protein IFR05_016751 [Cadophora sp. M221]